MRLKPFYLAVIVILGLAGCSSKEYIKQNSAFILFNTPAFKFADMGFIYENGEEMKVEIYGSGQALMVLEITQNKICMSSLECMPKSYFNKEVLNEAYPDETLENILRGRPLFGGLNLLKKGNGFTQTITNKEKYEIEYRVFNNDITFRDTINNIKISVKKQ